MSLAEVKELKSPIKKWVPEKKQLFINGKWVDAKSGKTFDVENPATGDIVAQAAEGDKADIDEAVKAARKAFESGPWKDMSASERGKIVPSRISGNCAKCQRIMTRAIKKARSIALLPFAVEH